MRDRIRHILKEETNLQKKVKSMIEDIFGDFTKQILRHYGLNYKNVSVVYIFNDKNLK